MEKNFILEKILPRGLQDRLLPLERTPTIRELSERLRGGERLETRMVDIKRDGEGFSFKAKGATIRKGEEFAPVGRRDLTMVRKALRESLSNR